MEITFFATDFSIDLNRVDKFTFVADAQSFIFENSNLEMSAQEMVDCALVGSAASFRIDLSTLVFEIQN